MLLLTKEEEKQVLFEFNKTVLEYPRDKTLIDLFEEQAEKNPSNIALVFKDEELTYQQLNERANQFAYYLWSKGIKQETPVPICIERSVEMIVAILGILKAGGAYVPIDPDFPEDRIKFILNDIGVKLVVGSTNSKAALLSADPHLDVITVNEDWPVIEQFPVENFTGKAEPHHLAYIIYTSGSTGSPKGVMVEHKSIYNYLLNSKSKFIKEGENNSGSFIHFPYTFDASLKSLFTPLVAGKSIVISSKQSAYVFEDSNLHKYAPYDFIQLTPSHLEFFWAEFKKINGKQLTKKLSIGGEALHKGHFDHLINDEIELEIVNEYGPTEATVACSGYYFNTLEDNTDVPAKLPIGKAIGNVQLYILNEDNQPVPVGTAGEICVGGVQIARGYLNQPELTDEKFIDNPFDKNDPSKIYKTGDLGRWLPDGNVEYVGRTDDQVKIRGHRIELGEIESILLQSDLVNQAAVVAKEDKEGKKQLVGYVVPNGIFDKKAIAEQLLLKLPHYMIPEAWVKLDSFPLSPNGKIDRKALPEPEIEYELPEDYVAPNTEDERKVAAIWREVIGGKQISINDNFFDIGGHSLLAVKILKLVERSTGKKLPLSTLFEYPTVKKFAEQLRDNSSKLPSIVALRATGSKKPLYIITGINGTAFAFRDFVNTLDTERPVFVLQEPQKASELEEFPDNVEDIAAFYISQILQQDSSGSYVIAGHSSGGIIAFEIAKQLEKAEKKVEMLVLFDTPAHRIENPEPGIRNSILGIKKGIQSLYFKSYKNVQLLGYNSGLVLKYRKMAFLRFTKKIKLALNTDKNAERYEFSEKVTLKYHQAVKKYKITAYNNDMILFRAKISSFGGGKYLGWKPFVNSLKVYEIEGEHVTMLHSKLFADLMGNTLDQYAS